MKLYGHPWSINTRKALHVVAEKGASVPLHVLQIARGEHKHASNLARHPFAKLPVLDDGGFVVYETTPILRYLDEVLDGVSLSPSNPRDRARALQWDRVHQSYFEPAVHPFVVHAVFARYLGFTANPSVLAAGQSAMARCLDVLEEHLRSTPYLGGESFTVADINWLPYLDYLAEVGEGGAVRERPAVAAWYDRIWSRPAWQQVAHSGKQPYEADADIDAVARSHGWVPIG